MSADNWAKCPRCTALAETEAENKTAAVRSAYGTVTPEEYERMAAEARQKPVTEKTFREDYSVTGAEDGVIQVEYGGSCDTCGLRVTFHYDHPVSVLGDMPEAVRKTGKR